MSQEFNQILRLLENEIFLLTCFSKCKNSWRHITQVFSSSGLCCLRAKILPTCFEDTTTEFSQVSSRNFEIAKFRGLKQRSIRGLKQRSQITVCEILIQFEAFLGERIFSFRYMPPSPVLIPGCILMNKPQRGQNSPYQPHS